MAQRLMVARAIMHDPDVLFLDEPTSGLDPQSRLALWDVIGELHAQGQTIVLTTHYMEEADQLCERVAIIDHGTLLALDTPDTLKATIGADDRDAHPARPATSTRSASELATMPGIDERTRASTARCSCTCKPRRSDACREIIATPTAPASRSPTSA